MYCMYELVKVKKCCHCS